MTEIATIDWFGRWETSFFSENTAIFTSVLTAYKDQHHKELENVLQPLNLYLSRAHCMCKDRRRMNA